jgi:glutaredoxin
LLFVDPLDATAESEDNARMLDRFKATLHAAITTPRGDSLLPIRVGKDIARRVNYTFGEVLGSAETLEKRRLAREKLAELRKTQKPATIVPKARLQAPVTVYHEGVRNARVLARVEEMLATKSITITKLDVENDEATLTFVMHTANCKSDDLPIVFVGDKCVGGYDALVQADVSGELEKNLFV